MSERARLKRLVAPSLLVAIVILFHWKLFLTDQYTWLGSPDLVTQVLPGYEFSAYELHKGRLPLWDPYSQGGQPMVGQMQYSLAYPLHWLFLVIPLDNGWLRESALHWYYILIRCWIALAMYALCRSLNRSEAASIAAGLIYTLGGIEINADWPQMVHATAWAPLVFLFLLRVVRGEDRFRNSVLSGCMLGSSWLCGHHAYPILITYAATGIWLYAIVRDRRWSLARFAAVFYLFTFLIGAMQLLPALEYGRLARRWVGATEPLKWKQIVPYNIHEQFALTPEGMLGIVFPYWAGGYDPYLGIVALGLALFGAAALWRDQSVRILSATGIFGLLYALAPATLLHGLFYLFVPMSEKTRAPTMATLLLSLAVASLAAFGIDFCMSRTSSIWRGRLAWGLSLFGAFLLATGAVLTARRHPVMDGEAPFLLTAIYAIVLAAWIAAVSRGVISRGWAGALPIILVVLELTKGPSSLWRNRSDHSTPDVMAPLRQDADLADFLHKQAGLWRIEITDPMTYNFGSWWGIETMTGGMSAGLTENLVSHEIFSRKFTEMMSVRFRIAGEPNRDDQKVVFDTGRGLKVYENRKAMPRTWITHQVQQFANRQALPRAFFAESLDLGKTTLMMDRPPKLETCDGIGDESHFTRRNPNKIELEATLDCRGILNLNNVYYPGWTVYVDGQPAKLYETYGVIEGAVVEKGRHKIVFRYRPWSVIAGAAISFTGLVLAFVACRPKKHGMIPAE